MLVAGLSVRCEHEIIEAGVRETLMTWQCGLYVLVSQHTFAGSHSKITKSSNFT